jgi:hypothetical protein
MEEVVQAKACQHPLIHVFLTRNIRITSLGKSLTSGAGKFAMTSEDLGFGTVVLFVLFSPRLAKERGLEVSSGREGMNPFLLLGSFLLCKLV